MRKPFLALLATALFLLALPLAAYASASNGCCITEAEEARLMKLPYDPFDQTGNDGWRKYGEGDVACYQLAAQLVDQYRKLHSPRLKDWQRIILSWHAGQMLAFDGNYPEARKRFVASYDPNEPADIQILWNDYVIASIAFLDREMDILKAHRDRIANGPSWEGKKPNLHVADNLIKYFDLTYAVAYSGGAKVQPPQRCEK
jgi:hypothetical protein